LRAAEQISAGAKSAEMEAKRKSGGQKWAGRPRGRQVSQLFGARWLLLGRAAYRARWIGLAEGRANLHFHLAPAWLCLRAAAPQSGSRRLAGSQLESSVILQAGHRGRLIKCQAEGAH